MESNAYMVRKYILPAFGHMTVDSIAVEHVKDWFASMAEKPGSANRAMPVLSTLMRMAELWSSAALRVAEHVESVHQSGATVSPV